MNYLYVINSMGEKEPFSFQKAYRSLRKIGADSSLAAQIAETIKKESYPGIKTSEIFKKINLLLSPQVPRAALRFNLKDAMRKLGPTGFTFEKFIGEIFKALGFEVKINQYIPGFCLDHYEIDFTAKKDNVFYIGECKYRNSPGERVHIQDALVNSARFSDISKGHFLKGRGFKLKTILVTNAKFTSQVVKYSNCMGLDLLGWKNPVNNGLEYIIEKHNLYPVTILPSLRGYLKDIFVLEKIMLVQEVAKIDERQFAKKFNVSLNHVSSIIREAKVLLGEK